jgi:hypothetical protein
MVAATGKQQPIIRSTASRGLLVKEFDLLIKTPSSFQGTATRLTLVAVSASVGKFLLQEKEGKGGRGNRFQKNLFFC